MTSTATHSEEFISEMKQALTKESEALKRQLEKLAHPESNHEFGGEYEANFPDYGRNDEDNATEIADYQATLSTTETIDERLKEVESALQRIEEGGYGVTEEGDLIPEDRLRANPAATTVIK